MTELYFWNYYIVYDYEMLSIKKNPLTGMGIVNHLHTQLRIVPIYSAIFNNKYESRSITLHSFSQWK